MGQTHPCNDCCVNLDPLDFNTTVVDKRRKRTRQGREGLALTDQTNLLLDKWNNAEVQQLMRVFKRNAPHRRMDREQFFHVFSELRHLPNAVAEAAFVRFDLKKTGSIDFREFCTAVAICCLSSRREQLHFVFDLFDEGTTGTLDRTEVRLLLQSTQR